MIIFFCYILVGGFEVVESFNYFVYVVIFELKYCMFNYSSVFQRFGNMNV